MSYKEIFKMKIQCYWINLINYEFYNIFIYLMQNIIYQETVEDIVINIPSDYYKYLIITD